MSGPRVGLVGVPSGFGISEIQVCTLVFVMRS